MSEINGRTRNCNMWTDTMTNAAWYGGTFVSEMSVNGKDVCGRTMNDATCNGGTSVSKMYAATEDTSFWNLGQTTRPTPRDTNYKRLCHFTIMSFHLVKLFYFTNVGPVIIFFLSSLFQACLQLRGKGLEGIHLGQKVSFPPPFFNTWRPTPLPIICRSGQHFFF